MFLASHGGQEPLSIARIAEGEDIPVAFLEQILSKLRRAGLVDSVRGVYGGFLLSRAPQEITLAEVIRVLEGSLSPIGCGEERERDELLAFCEKVESCKSRKVWVRMTEGITMALSSLTLADVVEQV